MSRIFPSALTRRLHASTSSCVRLLIWFVAATAALAATTSVAQGFVVRHVDLPTIAVAQLPPEGRQVLQEIHAGGPFASRRDGIPFGNRERLLPPRPRGYYAEYTVPTPGARNRGARRIVAGRGATGDFRTSDEYYYSDDHYQSFFRIAP